MAYQRITASAGTGGYQPLTGGGGAPVLAAAAPAAAPQPESLLHKILGAAAQVIVPVNVPHLITDVKDTAVGIGSLVGEGFHDVGRGVAQALPGQQNWGIVEDNPADSYHIDDVAKGLVGFAPQSEGGGYHPLNNGILGDYWKRYGPLLPGGAPATDTYQSFRSHPLSFILDAVGAASAAGKGAQIAGKSAVAGDEAAAALAASTTDDLVSSGIHAATAEQAGTRAALDALAETGKLTPGQELARKLLPEATYRFEGDKLVPTAEIRNPLLRAAATPIKNALSEPTSAVAERAAAGEDQIAKLLNIGVEPAGKLVTDTKLLGDIASEAASKGLARVDRPFLRDVYYPWRHSARVLTDMGAQHLLHRETAALPYREAIATAIEKDPTVAETFHLTATGLDVDLDGLETAPWAARFDESGAPISLGSKADAWDGLVKDEHGYPKRLYHGTSRTFENFGEANEDPNALYGPGVYMTEDPEIASKYATARRGDPPQFSLNFSPVNGVSTDEQVQKFLKESETAHRPVAVLERRPVSEDDLPFGTDPHPDGEHVTFQSLSAAPQIRGAFAKVGHPLDADAPIGPEVLDPVADALREKGFGLAEGPPSVTGKPSSYVVNGNAVIQYGQTGEEFYSRLARALPDGKADVNRLLEQVGFDGITHTGGKITGGKAHQVYIAFHPEQVTNGFVAPEAGSVATLERPVSDVMDPAVHAAAVDAVPAIAQRTDAVVSKVDEWMGQLQSEGPQMAESGWDVEAELDGARRLKRALNDGLERQMRAVRGEPVAPGVIAADNIRLIDAEKYADQFGLHTPREIVQRAYFPLRFKYGAKFDGDSMVGGPTVAEIDDALRDAGHAQPVYFPYLDATTAKPADFFRSRQLKGANVFAKDPHAKQLKGVLLKEGTYIEDPVEAYTRRAARAVREIETYNTFSTLTKTFGRRITSAEDVPTGWRIVAPDQLFLQHRTRLEFLDALDDLRSQGVDSDAALSQVLDRVMLRNTEDVTKALEGGAETWAVPEHVAKQMERASDLAKVVGSTTVQLAWDTPMKAWRGLVLTASPRWVVNNILGNTTFALMQGVKTADVLRIATERFRAMLAGWLEKKGGAREALGEFLGGSDLRENSLAGQVQKLPGAGDVGQGFTGTFEQQYVPRLGERAANTAVGKAITHVQESKAAAKVHSWGDAVKHLNSEIESSYREASYLTAIEKMQGKSAITRAGRSFWSAKQRMESIMSDGFNESKAKLALDEVNHFFGDYTRMSPFERHVVRRFIFPFWGFYRHQIKLLVTYPFDYPGRAIVLKNLGEVHQEMMKQYGALPSWLEGAVPLGPPGSEVSFFTTRGSDPFSGTFQPPTQMLSPIIKMALEQATGRSLYNGAPFTDRNVIENYGGMRINAETGQEAGNTAPGILEALLRNVPQYQELEQAVAGGKTYDTANLIDILSGQGAQTDATGAAKYPTDAGEQLMKLLGMSTTDYNLGGYQSYLAAQQEMAAKALAQRNTVTA